MGKGNHKTVGYLRVSTVDQDIEKNKADILSMANEKDLGRVEWVEEKVSGTLHWRKRKIGEVIESLELGDCLIVPEMSRLARSLLQILEIVETCTEKGIKIYAVKGNWTLNDSIESKVLLMALGMVAEIERDFISLRTREGLAARKAKGVRLGRPPGPGKSKLDPYREEIEQLLRNGSTKAFIARRYGTSEANLHNWIKKNKIDTRPVWQRQQEEVDKEDESA